MLNNLKNATNIAYTENGARAFSTTESALLDFFGQGGAIRNIDDENKIKIFTKAFAENPTLALRTLFYFRDVRGGQGERNTFRVIVKYLADYHTNSMRKNLSLIPFFGRWDDLYSFVDTKLEKDAFDIINTQFKEDMNKEFPSLLGKWMKSENASSKESKRLAKKTRAFLNLSSKNYRKSLTVLRHKISIVETKMSAKKWSEIDYSKLPSQAGMRYRQAFYRNDGERYEAFIDALQNGDENVKINAGTLYPYEIVREIRNLRYGTSSSTEVGVLDQLWKNLPDYFEGQQDNSMVVVDTSGSMEGLPIEIALSLGMYISERNKGQFHNHFMTFSSQPQLIELQGSNILEKINNMEKSNWGMSTDIKAVFDLILKTALDSNLSSEEMVSRILIVSDMEFDDCARGSNDMSLFETIRKEFEDNGYKMPNLVFWNVNARNAQFPSRMSDTGVQLVSGASPSIFKNLIKGEMLSAYDMMLEVINDERYLAIES